MSDAPTGLGSARHHAEAPAVVSRRRDSVSREIRLELAEWRSRTGGVYDLTPAAQARLVLPSGLAGVGDFLPDFIIVYATGEPVTVESTAGPVESVRWHGLRVHAGGIEWEPLRQGRPPRDLSHRATSLDWHSLAVLRDGDGYRTPPAPDWLRDLIRTQTPWGNLLDTNGAC